MTSLRSAVGTALSWVVSSGAHLIAALVSLTTLGIVILCVATAAPHIFASTQDATLGFASVSDDAIRSLSFAVVTSSAQVLLAIGVALACLAHWPLRGFVLLLLLTPYFIPAPFANVSFQLLFLPHGTGAQLLELAGTDVTWWTTSDGRFIRLLITSVWQFWPFAFLLAMARLLAVSPAESRSIALASRSRAETLVVIGLRHLVPILATMLIARLLFMASKFDLPFLVSTEDLGLNNLLAVELLRLLFSPSITDPARLARIAAPSTTLLLGFALLVAACVAIAHMTHRRTRPMEAITRRAFGWLTRYIRFWFTSGGLLLALFVLLPLIVLLCTAFTANSALHDGWTPLDSYTNPTLSHWQATVDDFQTSGSNNWLGAFARTLLLSVSASLIATFVAAVVGAQLALRLGNLRLLTQMLTVMVFGIPTALWIFCIAWASPIASQWLPAGLCIDDAGIPSLIRGAECQPAMLWLLHFVFISSIALYMSIAFWHRSTSYEGFRLLKLYGIDSRCPTQTLRALWVTRRRQFLGVCCAVFPIVFAVSWSDISFSKYLAADGQKLFVDAVVQKLTANSSDGTRFGQMAIAGLFTFAVAALMIRLVRRGLR